MFSSISLINYDLRARTILLQHDAVQIMTLRFSIVSCDRFLRNFPPAISVFINKILGRGRYDRYILFIYSNWLSVRWLIFAARVRFRRIQFVVLAVKPNPGRRWCVVAKFRVEDNENNTFGLGFGFAPSGRTRFASIIPPSVLIAARTGKISRRKHGLT